MNRFGKILGFAMCAGLACAAFQASAQVQYRRAMQPSVAPLPELEFSYVSFPGGAFPVTGTPHTIVLYDVARPLRPGDPAECNRPLTFALQLTVRNAGAGEFARHPNERSSPVVNLNIGGWSGTALIGHIRASDSQSMHFNVTLPPGNYTMLAKIDPGNGRADVRSNNNTLNWPLEVKCSANFTAPAPIGTFGVRRQ